MLILAIDPGLTGAYAVLNGTMATVEDLPTFSDLGRKRRTELDLHALGDALDGLHVDHAFLERVSARPGQGTVSIFRFGYCAGELFGLLVGLAVPITFTSPQSWQRHHGINGSPDAARQRAVQLFPALASRLARKRDAGRADALLLAAFGVHRLGQISSDPYEAINRAQRPSPV